MMYTGYGIILGTIECPVCNQICELRSGIDNVVELHCGHLLTPVPFAELGVETQSMEDLNIESHQVTSSSLKSIGYDASKQVLEVEFLPRQQGNTQTNTVRYNTVPQSVWDEFRTADSVGSYYHNKIKGKYPNVKPVNH